MKNIFRKCELLPWDVSAITFPNEVVNIIQKEQHLKDLKDGIY